MFTANKALHDVTIFLHPPPQILPHPLSFPGGGGGGTVTWSTQIFSVRFSLCCCVGDCVVGHCHLYPLYPPPPPVSRNRLAQEPPPGSAFEFLHYFFLPQNWVFPGCGGCRTAIRVCRTTFHVYCMACGVWKATFAFVSPLVNVFNCGKAEDAHTLRFFSAVRACSRSCARTNPWFRGRILGGKRAQEPTPGSAFEHCRFLDTGGGGATSSKHTFAPKCRRDARMHTHARVWGRSLYQ